MPRGIPRSRADNTLAPVGGDNSPQSAAPIEAVSPRAADVRRERRRRDDGDIDRMARLSLAVPHEIAERAKREGKVLRWFLNKPGRIAEAHDDDWDAVPNIAHVAAGQEDEEKLILMEKFKDWHVADLSAETRLIADREKAITAGTSPENRKSGDELVPGHEFQQLPRNRIGRNQG